MTIQNIDYVPYDDLSCMKHFSQQKCTVDWQFQGTLTAHGRPKHRVVLVWAKPGGEPMTMRKTPKMVAAEKRLRRPLEKALPELINENGLTATAKRLGVSKATLSYWLLKLGITLRRVALAPGETIEVKRVSD